MYSRLSSSTSEFTHLLALHRARFLTIPLDSSFLTTVEKFKSPDCVRSHSYVLAFLRHGCSDICALVTAIHNVRSPRTLHNTPRESGSPVRHCWRRLYRPVPLNCTCYTLLASSGFFFPSFSLNITSESTLAAAAFVLSFLHLPFVNSRLVL